jgi:hypothetical protein
MSGAKNGLGNLKAKGCPKKGSPDFFFRNALSFWRSPQPAGKEDHDYKGKRHHHKSGQSVFIGKTRTRQSGGSRQRSET